ncbi:MAG: aromatic ring-hydroxylating dioxygenase subunit alpha [Gammaproteobacteria bacterium]|nr:aromatic ring-hydroxylating dioxygenase subunit alpha [Gammaproteobacteria bacterium]
MTVSMHMPASEDRFSANPELSYTLPSYYYYDADIFEQEKTRIFQQTWQYVGHSERVSTRGDYFTCEVHGESIFVMRGTDGTLRAFYNVCSHRAHQLLSGSGNTSTIVCPYHAWSYELDGRLRYARNSESVAGFNSAEFCLKEVQVEVFLNFVFVNLDLNGPSLKDQTGTLEDEIRSFSPRLDELTLAHRRSYEIKANWKNIMENYSECYHCPMSHPSFANGVVDMQSYRITLNDIHHSHKSRSKPPQDRAYKFNGDVTAHAQEFGGWFIWPNLAIEVYPGGNLNVFHVMPVAPEVSLQHIEWYFLDNTPTQEETEIVQFLHDTVRLEDVELCESVQRGLRSRGYHQGRLVVDPERTDASEHAVHHFQSLVRSALAHQ